VRKDTPPRNPYHPVRVSPPVLSLPTSPPRCAFSFLRVFLYFTGTEFLVEENAFSPNAACLRTHPSPVPLFGLAIVSRCTVAMMVSPSHHELWELFSRPGGKVHLQPRERDLDLTKVFSRILHLWPALGPFSPCPPLHSLPHPVTSETRLRDRLCRAPLISPITAPPIRKNKTSSLPLFYNSFPPWLR